MTCALLLLGSAGCNTAPEGWIPVLEETSTTSLQREAETAAQRLKAAQLALRDGHAERADAELAAAEDSLDHLLSYYLPLLEARAVAYNAYRHHRLGRLEQAARDLDNVESKLLSVAESGEGSLQREMEEPLRELASARAGLRSDRADVAATLEALAIRLNALLVRGGLVLTE